MHQPIPRAREVAGGRVVRGYFTVPTNGPCTGRVPATMSPTLWRGAHCVRRKPEGSDHVGADDAAGGTPGSRNRSSSILGRAFAFGRHTTQGGRSYGGGRRRLWQPSSSIRTDGRLPPWVQINDLSRRPWPRLIRISTLVVVRRDEQGGAGLVSGVVPRRRAPAVEEAGRPDGDGRCCNLIEAVAERGGACWPADQADCSGL